MRVLAVFATLVLAYLHGCAGRPIPYPTEEGVMTDTGPLVQQKISDIITEFLSFLTVPGGTMQRSHSMEEDQPTLEMDATTTGSESQSEGPAVAGTGHGSQSEGSAVAGTFMDGSTPSGAVEQYLIMEIDLESDTTSDQPTQAPDATAAVPSDGPGQPTQAPDATTVVPSDGPGQPTQAPDATTVVPSDGPGQPTQAPDSTTVVPSDEPGQPTQVLDATTAIPSDGPTMVDTVADDFVLNSAVVPDDTVQHDDLNIANEAMTKMEDLDMHVRQLRSAHNHHTWRPNLRKSSSRTSDTPKGQSNDWNVNERNGNGNERNGNVKKIAAAEEGKGEESSKEFLQRNLPPQKSPVQRILETVKRLGFWEKLRVGSSVSHSPHENTVSEQLQNKDHDPSLHHPTPVDSIPIEVRKGKESSKEFPQRNLPSPVQRILERLGLWKKLRVGSSVLHSSHENTVSEQLHDKDHDPSHPTPVYLVSHHPTPVDSVPTHGPPTRHSTPVDSVPVKNFIGYLNMLERTVLKGRFSQELEAVRSFLMRGESGNDCDNDSEDIDDDVSARKERKKKSRRRRKREAALEKRLATFDTENDAFKDYDEWLDEGYNYDLEDNGDYEMLDDYDKVLGDYEIEDNKNGMLDEYDHAEMPDDTDEEDTDPWKPSHGRKNHHRSWSNNYRHDRLNRADYVETADDEDKGDYEDEAYDNHEDETGGRKFVYHSRVRRSESPVEEDTAVVREPPVKTPLTSGSVY